LALRCGPGSLALRNPRTPLCLIVESHWPHQTPPMSREHLQPAVSDLFSTKSGPPAQPESRPPSVPFAAATHPHRHSLPKDLPNAIKNLTDQELDQLGKAVLVEQQRRGRKSPSNENLKLRQAQESDVPLTVGRLNAIRAAFKAGLTPARIARQFRVSQSAVRKALSGDKKSAAR
jgi:hypothetical protein